jgi:MoaA/NifB/PqqE/SkfB family radical SAM enzyme
MTIKPRIQLNNRESLADAIPLSTPWTIFVDPSSRCNFACRFCPNHQMRDKGIMTWQTYKKIIKQISKFPGKLKVLRLYMMGEPLLNPEFPRMIAYARDAEIADSIDTTTNASLLNPELSKKIIAAGLDRINISINGINDNQYKKFTGAKVDFKKLVENIAYFYLYAKNICEVIIKINGDYCSEFDIRKFIEVFEPIADGINIEHTAPCWPNFEVKNINKKIGIYGQQLSDVKTCPYIFYSMAVHYDGEVSLCFLDWQKTLLMGDVNKTTLKKIWNSNMWEFWRHDMLCGRRDHIPVCIYCQQLKYGMPVDLDKQAPELIKRIWG